MINLRKSGRASVPGSRVRSHFAVRRDLSPGCRRTSFGSQSSRNPTSTDSNPRNSPGWRFGEGQPNNPVGSVPNLILPTDCATHKWKVPSPLYSLQSQLGALVGIIHTPINLVDDVPLRRGGKRRHGEVGVAAEIAQQCYLAIKSAPLAVRP